MPCRDTVATGLTIGMFFAVMPVPMQMIFAGVLAMRLRSNVPIAMAACWLSNPLTNIPLFIGQLWLGNEIAAATGIHLPDAQWFKDLMKWLNESSWLKVSIPDFILNANSGNFILGAVVSGVLLAAVTYPLVYLFAVWMPHHLPARPNRNAKVSSFMRKIRAQLDAKKQVK
jgi:uncharacterized protein